MKKSFIKVLSFVIVVLMSVSILGGCSGEKKNPEKSSDTTATGTQSENTAEQTAADEKFDLKGYEVRISAWWDGTPQPGTEIGDALVARHKEIEEKYNCKITYLNLPNAETIEKLTATALSGDPMADIIHLEANQAIPGLAAAGFLMPVDEYFDNFKDTRWPQNIKKMSTFNGKTYGFITRAYSSHGIWYNKTLFKRESLPDLYELQEKGEWTWDKYKEIATKATKDRDGDGKIDQFGITIGYDITDKFIWSNGGNIVAEDGGKYTFNLDTEEARQAIDFVGEIWKANVVGSESEAGFVAGKAAMYGGEAWMGGSFKNNMDDEVGYVFYPKGPKATDYTSVVTNTVIATFPATAKYPKEVAKIFTELTLWDMLEKEKVDFIENNVTTEEDIETVKKMITRCQLNTMDAFPGLSDAYWAIVDMVKLEGASASTAIAEYKQYAQSAIDAIFKK